MTIKSSTRLKQNNNNMQQTCLVFYCDTHETNVFIGQKDVKLVELMCYYPVKN